MNKFVSINFCGGAKSSNATISIVEFSVFIFDWKIRNEFRINKFCACVLVSKVKIQSHNFNVQTQHSILYFCYTRTFEFSIRIFQLIISFCFSRILQISIVVLMVIACTNAKPAIVAAPAAIAYSAPLVAAAAPAAPLPFVTATSSQVVRSTY